VFIQIYEKTLYKMFAERMVNPENEKRLAGKQVSLVKSHLNHINGT
jgi:hypothetical protein